ncbi:hypothetical protein [Brucella intermedia]|uniref:hypothetical protein n=1 Tax=Brucella intermedia TaxID=94625 RepID=UPI00124C4F7A|nr:hypothetical protein [Brucella intermedia]KAB2729802.1 hypothetical protein F9L02_14575 [Brucella intermedia]
MSYYIKHLTTGLYLTCGEFLVNEISPISGNPNKTTLWEADKGEITALFLSQLHTTVSGEIVYICLGTLINDGLSVLAKAVDSASALQFLFSFLPQNGGIYTIKNSSNSTYLSLMKESPYTAYLSTDQDYWVITKS